MAVAGCRLRWQRDWHEAAAAVWIARRREKESRLNATLAEDSTIVSANRIGRALLPLVVLGGVCLAAGSVLAQAPSSTEQRIQDRTYKFKEAGGLEMAYS